MVKLWHSYTTEYYSAINMSTTLIDSCKNLEDLSSIMLSEKNYSQKVIYRMTPFIQYFKMTKPKRRRTDQWLPSERDGG